MRFPTEPLSTAQDNLADHAHGRLAPMVMWNPMLLLLGDREVVTSLAHGRFETDLTTWRALWLTDRQLIFSEASKALEGWTAHADDKKGSDPRPDTFNAWAAPLREIVTLEIPEQSVKRVVSHDTEDDRVWRYEGHARVVLKHGTEVHLPLFPDDDQFDVEGVVAMLGALADRL